YFHIEVSVIHPFFLHPHPAGLEDLPTTGMHSFEHLHQRGLVRVTSLSLIISRSRRVGRFLVPYVHVRLSVGLNQGFSPAFLGIKTVMGPSYGYPIAPRIDH